MIKMGIAGTGAMALERFGAFNCLSDVSVSGVYSRSAERADGICKDSKAQYFDDYSRMISEVDAVCLCLPNDLHLQFALEALEKKKHVLVEYPLALSMADVVELQTAAAASEVVLMVGNTIICEAMFNYIKTNLDRVGEIVSAASRVAFYSDGISDAWYMKKDRRGSVFVSLLYHHIEYYKQLLGEVRWVYGIDQSRESDGFIGGALNMGHIQNRTSCIQWYLSDQGSSMPRGFWLNGTKGSVTVISTKPDKSEIIWGGAEQGDSEIIKDDWGVGGSCEDFEMAIKGGLDHKARLDSDIVTMRIALAAEESSQEGAVVNMTT